MLLAKYINMAILRTGFIYLCGVVCLLSGIELLEKYMMLPFSLSYTMWLSMWLLSLPTYLVMFLPVSYFASLVHNHIHWADTQQSLVFSAVGWSYNRRWKSIAKHALMVVGLMLLLGSFAAPWCRQYEQVLLKEAINKPWKWQLSPGHFGHINLGSKKMLAYQFDDKDDARIFLIPPDQEQSLTWLHVRDLTIAGSHQANLLLHDGQSVSIQDEQVVSTLDFGEMSMPIMPMSMHFLNVNDELRDSYYLLTVGSKDQQALLLWRLNSLLFLLGLVWAGSMLLSEKHCRIYPRTTAIVGCYVYVTYFFALMWAKTLAVSYEYGWYYLLAHLYVVVLSYLLVYVSGKLEALK